MKIRLKKLSEQVVVITGATSGIGLTTARRAAERGAKVVLAARNEDALKQLTFELSKRGCEAIHVVADVGIEEDVRNVAQAAIERFGGFDTWINNAGISIFGRLEDVSLEDQRKLFQTNFWGVVHGSLVAVEHFKQRGGGAIINLGSEVSDRAMPLQGAYSASKHAVKGFTDSLRSELEAEDAPISVTLIKPAAIDTMFVDHAKNYLDVEPKLPPPIYAPEIAADAILFAAENVKRDIFIGAAAKLVSSTAHYAPRMMDGYIRRFAFGQQKSDLPARDRSQNSLYGPGSDLQERQGPQSCVRIESVYAGCAASQGHLDSDVRPRPGSCSIVAYARAPGAHGLIPGRHRSSSFLISSCFFGGHDMAHLNSEQLAHLKQLLDERDRVLRTDLFREVNEKDEYLDVATEIPDPGDSSFANLAVDLGNAAVTRDLTELRAVEAARQRMENGVYGVCVSCETDIPYERLKVQPTAERCAPCQEHYEKTHGDAMRGNTM